MTLMSQNYGNLQKPACTSIVNVEHSWLTWYALDDVALVTRSLLL